jgi:diacylglycerol kinase family enzyme
MVIMVNAQASGGRARRRWEHVRRDMDASGAAATAFLPRTGAELDEIVRLRLVRGEDTFIAGGGDGTVNRMVNTLAGLVGPQSLSRLAIGALGLGSSNDFHKPFRSSSTMHGTPAAIDPSGARSRDAVCVTITHDGSTHTRWFLLNGGFGFTASANALFNGSEPATRLLKRVSTTAAIIVAILRTLYRMEDRRLMLASPAGTATSLPVTNLAVLKSRWVSGSLAFPEAWTADGMLGIVLLTRARRIQVVRFLADLLRGRCRTSEYCRHFLTQSLAVSSPVPLALELDGEIEYGSRFVFHVHRNLLKVCV